VYCVLCTVYCVLCTVYCVLCTVYCVLCTVYCVPLTFAWKGDLRYFLDTRGEVSWSVRLRLLNDAAQGMAFAHGQRPPLIHKDLVPAFPRALSHFSLAAAQKSRNVFVTNIDGRFVAKVADLGLAEVIPNVSKVCVLSDE
jgi:hypothetical protein